jgi:hypothetical protein
MLTRGFFYFLMISELAILGLLVVGIFYKLKRIMHLYFTKADDQNFEHGVSGSDHPAVPGDAAVSTPSDESPRTSLSATMHN